MTPLAVAAERSTLSTPIPARPTTLSCLARSSSFAVTLVAERMASPSNSPMISASWSLSRLGLTTVSMPRSAKICTAAGESLSEMRTRGAMAASRCLAQRVLALRERPIEPGGEPLDVGGLDGRAAPDAQAGRRVAIERDIIGDAFFLERRRHAAGEGCPRIERQRRDRRIDHL